MPRNMRRQTRPRRARYFSGTERSAAGIGIGCGWGVWLVAWAVIAGPALIIRTVTGKKEAAPELSQIQKNNQVYAGIVENIMKAKCNMAPIVAPQLSSRSAVIVPTASALRKLKNYVKIVIEALKDKALLQAGQAKQSTRHEVRFS